MGKKKYEAKTLVTPVSIPVVPGSAQIINPTYLANHENNFQNINHHNPNYPQ